MRATWTVYRRELAGLFYGPLAWILLCLALALGGWFFTTTLKGLGGDVTYALRLAMGDGALYWATMVFLPPLLTMRMISEESRTGLLEFLLTAPVSDFAVVLGKFLAALSFMALLWSSVLVYAGAVHAFGTAPDWSAVLGGFLGSVLTSGLFCAIGLLASAVTSTPLVAAFLGFVLNLLLLLAPTLAKLSEYPALFRASGKIDVQTHYQRSFLIGVFDSGAAVFFVVWTCFFLFLATRAIESRRWR